MKPAQQIPHVEGFCPEHVFGSAAAAAGNGALIDYFGRAHGLADPTTIGRDQESASLAVLEASVSRQHARLSRSADRWVLEDLGSTNGTYVDGVRVSERRPLLSGQLVVFGDVGFIYVEDAESAFADSVTHSVLATQRTKREGIIRLVEPTRGGGGVLTFEGRELQLGMAQFALLRALAERYREDLEKEETVRGFVPSHELLAVLPWDTPSPEGSHLKQLVRRVRRALEKIDLVDAIESRQRFGYRLVIAAAVLETAQRDG
ncbi:MAG: FHA domain-containing protein [Myxococcota bacterium]